VLCVDVVENDRTLRNLVPRRTTAGAAIHTNVCDGRLSGGVSGGLSARAPDAVVVGCWFRFRFDSGAYSCLQFLRAVSHSVGALTESLQPRDDNSSSENEDSQAPMPAALDGFYSYVAVISRIRVYFMCYLLYFIET